MPDRNVILYTRQGCHLCEDAMELLQRYTSQLDLVDIDQSPELLSQFNECVPVVEIDGKIYFRGKINEVLLRRLFR